MPLTDLTYVDAPEQFDDALASVASLGVVGVDVERADWDRYWRAAALIQVGGEGRVAVIDPLLISDLGPLDAFLGTRTTVLHALENDLGPLSTAGVEPPHVADTAIAAAMLGLPTGLETLLADLLEVELPGDKSAMQRADWEHRPLSADMLAYAAADVADLPALWRELERRLHEAGRWEWYRQELEATCSQPPVEQRREWTRLKGIGRLDPRARARVRSLWQAREELARRTDTAPGRIANDRVIVDLAVDPPDSRNELGRRGVRRRAIREFGDELVAALSDLSDVEPLRTGEQREAPSEEERELADRLRSLRAERAQALGIDAGVLCPSRTLLGAVLARPHTPEELRDALGLLPWQWEQLREPFCEALGIGVDG